MASTDASRTARALSATGYSTRQPATPAANRRLPCSGPGRAAAAARRQAAWPGQIGEGEPRGRLLAELPLTTRRDRARRPPAEWPARPVPNSQRVLARSCLTVSYLLSAKLTRRARCSIPEQRGQQQHKHRKSNRLRRTRSVPIRCKGFIHCEDVLTSCMVQL